MIDLKEEFSGCVGVIIGIIAALISLSIVVVFPILALALIILALVSYVIHDVVKKNMKTRQLKQEQIMKERRIIFLEQKKKALIESGNYRFIEDFVRKFPNRSYNQVQVDNLSELLNQKGEGRLIRTDLLYFIEIEERTQEYHSFKQLIKSTNPKNVDEVFENFVEIFGENYRSRVSFLRIFLEQNNVDLAEHLIVSRIEEIKKKRELALFEKQLQSGHKKVTIRDLDLMTGYEFEDFLKSLFQRMGYAVRHTSLSGDQGADLVVEKFGQVTVVQAKRYTGKVSNKAVQEVTAAIPHYNAHKGMVVTTSFFTKSAWELARSNNIELVNRTALESLIKRY